MSNFYPIDKLPKGSTTINARRLFNLRVREQIVRSDLGMKFKSCRNGVELVRAMNPGHTTTCSVAEYLLLLRVRVIDTLWGTETPYEHLQSYPQQLEGLLRRLDALRNPLGTE